MPKVALPPGVTDEDYVLGLLRATGVLCVYGSGFGTAPEDGFFRVVFLAVAGGAVGHLRPRSADFTRDFLAQSANAEVATRPAQRRSRSYPVDDLR